jgi:hypothetical protein
LKVTTRSGVEVAEAIIFPLFPTKQLMVDSGNLC